MSSMQKVIKYCAMAFALFLTMFIISSLISGVIFIGHFFDNDNSTHNFDNIDINGEVLVLDIEVSNVNIIIKEGDTLSASSNDSNIKIEQTNRKLYITQKDKSWFYEDSSDLIVYVPSTLIFDGVSINGGAGKISIESLTTNELYLELGAGKLDVDELIVLSKTEINGGAGKMTISSGSLNNLDLDMGVGKTTITSSITGTSDIDAGVGKLDLNLIGNENDYKIIVEKGIGSISIDSNNVENGTYGSGINTIDIDGGVGSIDINYLKN